MTNLKPIGRPSKHHYIPECYLKGWVAQGQLVEFRKGYQGRLFARLTSPGGTGYAKNLYSVPELQEHAEALEEQFFQMVDTRASDVLEAMRGERPFRAEHRQPFATFLMSILLRSPESIEALAGSVAGWWRSSWPGLQEIYDRHYRAPGDPADVMVYLETHDDPLHVFRMKIELFTELMTHQRLGNYICRMHWGVLALAPNAPRLLTSDRPVIMTNGLDNEEGHLALPISPSRMFLACTTGTMLRQLLASNSVGLAKRSNRLVVERARRFVYGADERQSSFIAKWFGANPIPSLGEVLADKNPWTAGAGVGMPSTPDLGNISWRDRP